MSHNILPHMAPKTSVVVIGWIPLDMFSMKCRIALVGMSVLSEPAVFECQLSMSWNPILVIF